MRRNGNDCLVAEDRDVQARLVGLQLREAKLKGKLSDARAVRVHAEKRIGKLKRKLNKLSNEISELRNSGTGKRVMKSSTSSDNKCLPIVQLSRAQMHRIEGAENVIVTNDSQDDMLAEKDEEGGAVKGHWWWPGLMR